MSKIKVLLYYKYVELAEPDEVRDWQKQLCKGLNILGRIIVAKEGINGTVAGSKKEIDEYMKETNAREEFADMEWKVSYVEEQVFPKLSVKVRDEIVTLGVQKSGVDVNMGEKAAYIEPEELLELYESEEDFVILDARNKYEADLGKFKGALIPPIDNFRDFPKFVDDNLEEYKDKTVVSYCTGGIRCEKATAYLREQGFNNVRQLHGGVHTYAKKTGGKYFEGELFVFDKRLQMQVNEVDPSVVAECLFCSKKVSRLVDCSEETCGELINCCEKCEVKYSSTCSKDCLDKIHENMNTYA